MKLLVFLMSISGRTVCVIVMLILTHTPTHTLMPPEVESR